MKFRYLKIDLTSQTTYNCHAALPHRIDFKWLNSNPGNLFNSDVNIAERRMMLRNERNSSCETNCWHAEDNGAVSPRMYQCGEDKTHFEPITTPEILDLTLNSECNLTCSYCCKEFSNSWRRDLIDNGEYLLSNFDDYRYRLTKEDKILNLVSQQEMHSSSRFQTLLNEIRSFAPKLKRLDITGGEPMLDNQLLDMLESFNLSSECEINLYTGLGVNEKRFEKIITALEKIPNVCIKVSAESVGEMLEFNRYGIKYNEFQRKIDILNRAIKWSFHCTITNLNVLGFVDFYNQFPTVPKTITFGYQPRFLSPYVMDVGTKEMVKQDIAKLPSLVSQPILQSLESTPTEEQRIGLREFLCQFVERRKNLNLNIFPETFLLWTGVKNVV